MIYELRTQNSHPSSLLRAKQGSPSVALPARRSLSVVGAKQGQMLVILLILLFVVAFLMLSLFSRLGIFLKSSTRSTTNDQATALADGGVDWAIIQMNKNGSLIVSNVQIILGIGQAVVTIADKSPGVKTVTSRGCVPDCARAISADIIQVFIASGDVAIDESIPITYALQSNKAGPNASVFIDRDNKVIGNVSSNSLLSSESCTSQNCVINGNVISMNYPSQLLNFTITGTISRSLTDRAMPPFNETIWKNAAASGGVTDCAVTPADCNIYVSNYNTLDLGPRKYIGNLQISFDNTSTINIKGPIYVTGNLTILGEGDIVEHGKIKTDESFGPCGTVFVADGQITFDSITDLSWIEPTGTNGYLLFVSLLDKIWMGYTNPQMGDGAINVGRAYVKGVLYAKNGSVVFAREQAIVSGAVAGENVGLGPGGDKTNYFIQYDINYVPSLQTAKFCGTSKTWKIVRGSYKIRK